MCFVVLWCVVLCCAVPGYVTCCCVLLWYGVLCCGILCLVEL